AGRPDHYQTHLESWISNWRELYQAPELPFLLVQLPNYLKKSDKPQESGWAEIREAQLKDSQEVPHTARAVTYDVGEWNDIHPLNKKDIAHRLHFGTRKLSYAGKIVSAGPLYQDKKIGGDKVVLYVTEID